MFSIYFVFCFDKNRNSRNYCPNRVRSRQDPGKIHHWVATHLDKVQQLRAKWKRDGTFGTDCCVNKDSDISSDICFPQKALPASLQSGNNFSRVCGCSRAALQAWMVVSNPRGRVRPCVTCTAVCRPPPSPRGRTRRGRWSKYGR